MIQQRVLLIGRGHLGSVLQARWKLPSELHWAGEMQELDAAILQRLRPDVVINTAGKTDLRWCEENPRECFRCNVSAPLSVYRAVKAAFGGRVPYIQLSSGCIWDGPYRADGLPFEPEDPPTPACFYSWTKASCDALLRAEPGVPLLILRPRQVYSALAAPRNTLSKLNSYPRLLDTPNSMTSADTIALTIETVLARNDDSVWNRVLNVYDRGITSPYEVGRLLAAAECRAVPERLVKSDLDTWHRPKRVDAVIHDAYFEHLVKPPAVQDELRRVIGLFAPRWQAQQART